MRLCRLSTSAVANSGYVAVTPATLNPKLVEMEYAVRGRLVARAEEHSKVLKRAAKNGEPNPLPFSDLVFCNIGNPQSVGQSPITFFRQVLALCANPQLLQNDTVVKEMPEVQHYYCSCVNFGDVLLLLLFPFLPLLLVLILVLDFGVVL